MVRRNAWSEGYKLNGLQSQRAAESDGCRVRGLQRQRATEAEGGWALVADDPRRTVRGSRLLVAAVQLVELRDTTVTLLEPPWREMHLVRLGALEAAASAA